MTTDLRIVTTIVLPVPVVLAVASAYAPTPVRLVLLGASGFVASIYLVVWCWWRPSRFEIDARGLTLVWPLRSRTLPMREIREISILDRNDFRREYRYGIRVGAGGLWGGFGWLMTAKGALAMYISRTDAFVRIHCAGERPILITPEQPKRFLEELEAVVVAGR